MKRISFLLLFFSVAFGHQACTQNNKNKVVNQNNNTMDGEYIKKMLNVHAEIKTFDYNPTYQIRVNAIACTYEVYVNDMLADFSFGAGNTAGEQNVDIPQYILKSGKQAIRIKVYPKALKAGEPAVTLDQDAAFSVRVMYGEYGKEKPDAFKQVLKFEMPHISHAIPVFEHETVFEAKVPYTLNGWSNGVDLSKEDKDVLTREVKAVYDTFAHIFETRDLEAFSRLTYNRRKEVSQAYFFKEASNDKEWFDEMQTTMKNFVSIKELNDNKLTFYGNGRVVGLVVTSGRFKDRTAFAVKVSDGIEFYPILLYRPKAGAPLEVIR